MMSGAPSSQEILSMHVEEFAYAPEAPPLLANLDLVIGQSELVGVMGPNGSGKSTLLYLVSGEISSQMVQRRLGCDESNISFVYQDYRHTLFPWKTASSNISLPGRLRGASSESESSIKTLVESFEISFDLGKRPFELSGGEQQKVCVIRALIEDPRLLLMDEPCSAMDYGSRLIFLRNLRTRLKDRGTACVLVSHSAEDAFVFCDRLLLLSKTGTIADMITGCPNPGTYTANIERVHAHFLE
jgi:NitT/TauT family transport system ATP-binding protein